MASLVNVTLVIRAMEGSAKVWRHINQVLWFTHRLEKWESRVKSMNFEHSGEGRGIFREILEIQGILDNLIFVLWFLIECKGILDNLIFVLWFLIELYLSNTDTWKKILEKSGRFPVRKSRNDELRLQPV